MATRTTPKTPKGRPQTYDHLKSSKKTPIRKVTIPMDDEIAARWQDLQTKVTLPKMRLDMGIDNPDIKKQVMEELAEIQKELDEVEAKMEVAVFKFKGLGRKKYEKFKGDPKFVPTPEQEAEAKKRQPGSSLPWNPDTFPPAIIQVCCVEPEMTVEQAYELWDSDDWTEAELLLLLGAAMEVNENVRNIDWGKG